jgi:hypothetical protein
VLHLSNVALPKNAPGGRIVLLASMGKDLKDLTLATLQKDKVETLALDIYINVTQQVELSVQGGGELHLSGFFEPQRDDMDDNMFMGDEDEDEDEDDEEAPELTNGKLNQSLKQAKVNAAKNAQRAPMVADDDSDDDEDFDEDEDEDDDDEDSDEEEAAAAALAA